MREKTKGFFQGLHRILKKLTITRLCSVAAFVYDFFKKSELSLYDMVMLATVFLLFAAVLLIFVLLSPLVFV